MFKRLFILLLLLLVYSCKPVSAAKNLALRKACTFLPKPNYRLCTDGSDVIQLTDGRTFGSQWTKKSTVGWEKAEPAVEIVIDLGQRSAVYEVRIHTVGGGRANHLDHAVDVGPDRAGQALGFLALPARQAVHTVGGDLGIDAAEDPVLKGLHGHDGTPCDRRRE